MTDGTTLLLDTETWSETPIKDGTHKYSETAEIMIAAWALDDPLWGEGDIVVEDLVDDWGNVSIEPSEHLINAILTADTIVMHNGGQFDRTVIRHAWGNELPLERIEDTMAQAMAHGLPGGLDKLSAIFKLGEDSKHEGGRELIRLFCMPAPKKQKLRRRTKVTHPEEWQRFLSYAGGDIRSMRALRAKLPRWNYPGTRGNHATGHDAWVLDQTINDRGFKVDTDLAREAIDMVERCKEKYDAYVEETTYGQVETAAQTQKLLAHLLGEYGVSLPDMQKGTLERRMDDPNLPGVVKELLSVRLDVAKASPTKYAALLRSASSDGRLRGTTQFCGAVRTGRSAGRIFQAKNLIRPNDAEAQQQDNWVEAIKSGIGEMLLDNPTRAAGVCLRGSVIAEEGKKLVVADLAQVEARVLAWGAGEDWKLQAFRDFDAGLGPDVYKVTAGRILRKHASEVTKDERQMMGKVPDLACGFQGAAGAFGTMMRLYGLDLETKEVKRIVDEWREANAKIKQFWYDLEQAAREATLNPGVTTYAGEHASFNRWREWLRMKLPSGHVLCYTQPRIEPHKKFANSTALSYLGVNSYTRKWERIQTYGGKLCLAAGTLVLTDSGWLAIEYVDQLDRLWDGEEWVETDGLIDNGVTEVIKVFGTWMTAGHQVLTTEGWRRASQSEGHHRAACRLPDGYRVPGVRWKEEPVGSDLRVRDRGGDAGDRAAEAEEPGDHRVVRVQTTGDYWQAPDDARDDQSPCVLGLALDDRSLQAADASGVAQLRRQGDQGLPTLAGELRGVLGGHGSDVPDRAIDRAEGQQRSLRAGELQVGDQERTGSQQKVKARVYDLTNCGPRSRFVIATEDGPLIVHNCENWTQATATGVWGIIGDAMLRAEAAGYKIVMETYDELVCEVPDTEEFTTEGLCSIISERPWWADERLPLAAEGFEAKRYRK